MLIALGPTVAVLAYDLCKKGYQAIDTGTLEFKYVDSGKKGRKVQTLQDPEYKRKIIKSII